ncbi:MAG: DPP IV N-terminal domain-containing protein [Bacteroidota bacterium]
MIKKSHIFISLLALLLASCSTQTIITRQHYQKAETFLQPSMSKLVYHVSVQPHWLSDSSGFWHVTQTREGKRFFFTNLQEESTRQAFDHEILAQLLGERSGESVDAADLPFSSIKYDEKNLVVFRFENRSWQFNTDTHELTEVPYVNPGRLPGVSPDSTMQAFINDYNLYIRDLKTNEVRQISHLGKHQYEYANTWSWSNLMEGEDGKRPENFFVSWSPDSRRIFTYITDLSKAEKMYLLDFSVDTLYRPRLLSYYRGSPGDTTIVYNIPVIFDIETGEEILVDVNPIPHFIWANFQWTENSDSLFAIYAHRGFKRADLIKVDAATGNINVLLSEKSPTSVEYSSLMMQRVGNDKVLMSSHQSGWHHLYFFDWHTGALVNPVTEGEYMVRSLLHVDEQNQLIFFMASGREAGRNPYYTHLYRINFDGSGLTLLTPEDAHHEVSLSPCKRFFVDNYSRVDLPTRSVVRELSTGEKLFRISEADIEDLLATGWRPPMQFSVKGRDGLTDIYGVIYQPVDFNPRKKYPVIDYTYSGPHTSIIPKSFSNALFNIQNPLRAFGFAIVVVDGMGTAHRSSVFRDVSYRNLGGNMECHVVAIRQLARQYSWLDTTRIGIYGHSAGGYDATRAMLMYPDFYKVGVSSAADHDHRMEKAWWPEMYMGYPVGDYYHEQSNITNAHKLRGRLLIAHGALDENVNPSATYKLAEQFIKAGIDFDMLILPSTNHSFGRSEGDYFTRVRWNYFIRHLLPSEPIHNYGIDE